MPVLKLYFAYGNNLWLARMAELCPDSYYVGRAVLPDYYWYINQRGIANIVPRSGFTVHGLVYGLTTYDDEINLDRSEREQDGGISKMIKCVSLYKASYNLQVHTQDLVHDGVPMQVTRTGRHLSMAAEEHRGYTIVDVMVYMSAKTSRSGHARDDYIEEMNYGIRDAMDLGVPTSYFKNTIRKWIPNSEILHNSSPRRSRHPIASSRRVAFSANHSNESSESQRSSRESRHSAPKKGRKHKRPDVIVEVWQG
ncbi:hypothetical protein F5Y14DRAFT_192788 [Nemania sp. NC0429]|nr:hypothetical protein F5Y14DRAFT_192788 [Nemania sp. NC0429]